MNNQKNILNRSSFECFSEEIANQINNVVNGSITAQVCNGKKNNDVCRTGIVMKKENQNFAPIIYLEESFEQYLRGESVANVAQKIIGFYSEMCGQPFSFNASRLSEFACWRDKIFFKIVNTEKNHDTLLECPHFNYMDLSVLFYVLLDRDSSQIGTFPIKNEHMRQWEISKEELSKIAYENSQKLMPPIFFTIEENLQKIMYDIVPKNLLLENESHKGQEKPSGLYVLTNELYNYGAGCIFYSNILDKVGDIIGEDFYILPSSIHESIIAPISVMEQDEINEMICEINETDVLEEERLGNHCYRYSITERKFY